MSSHEPRSSDPNAHLPEPQGVAGHLPATVGSNGHMVVSPGFHAVPAVQTAATGGAGEMDTMALFKALQRRWLLAASLGLVLAAAAAAGAWFGLAPKDVTFALVRVKASPNVFLEKTSDQAPELLRNDYDTFRKTQAAIIRGRFVLSAALSDPNVQKLSLVQEHSGKEDPVAWLEDALKVDSKDLAKERTESREGSEFVTVSMTDRKAEEQMVIIDAVIDAYLKQVVEKESKAKQDRLVELERVTDAMSSKLRSKRNLLKELSKKLGSSDTQALSQRQQMAVQHHSLLLGQLTSVRFELSKAKTRLEAHKLLNPKEKPITVPESSINQALASDPQAKELMGQIPGLQSLVRQYEETAKDPNEPKAVQAKKRLKSVQTQLATARRQVKADLLEQMRQQALENYQAELTKLELEVTQQSDREKELAAAVAQARKDADIVGNSSTEVEMLRNEIETDDAMEKRMRAELEKQKLELNAKPRVEPFQRAALQQKSAKRQVLATVVAPVAVLGLVCFGVSWWELRARRIQTVNEVVSGLRMRVVGTVPALSRRRGRSGEVALYEHNFTESIDAIRTLLLREAALEGTRVVMVSSAVAGEGKTTLASHLAGSLARAGRRTLIIDCDLRRPALHELFEVTLQPGFAEVLLGEAEPAAAVRSTAVDDLWILPAGQWDRAVLQALAKDGVQRLLAELKGQYDFIVVDSHPILTANDSLLVGQYVDGVILSLLRGMSQSPSAGAACERLAALGIRVLGAVVNGMDDRVFGYRYGYAVPAAR